MSYDAVVIGAGHNGLVSACYLAKAGQKVLVLERYHTVGGAAITEEIHPGFRVSVASYSCSLLRPEIIRDLRLPDYGFEVYAKQPSYFMPFPDGRHLFLYADNRAKSKAEIAKFSHKDAEAYDRWEEFWDRVSEVVEPTLMQPPISLGQLADRFAAAGYEDDFRRIMLLSTTDLLDEFFESEQVKAAMAPQSLIGTSAGPMTPGTPYIWLIHAVGRAIGSRGVWGYVRGGMGAITQAMAKAALDLGVEIRTSAPVAEILIEGGQATGVVLESGETVRARAVLSNAHPQITFLRLCSSLPPDLRDRLERHYRDMQDIEFTVQKSRLYVLQTRTGKRTAAAALKIAVDMAREGLITREEALLRIDPAQLDQLLHPTLDPKAERRVIAKGLPASPGAVSGKVVMSAEEAERLAAAGEAVILVRIETSPDDIHGMHAARGILTARGGMTSHAAVVARGMGKPCVCGAGDLLISYEERAFGSGGVRVAAGEVITIDGSTGEVMLGAVKTIDPQLSGDFATLMSWADEVRRLRVRTNAETPLDARTAVRFGCEGIGLCRTEHMFFQEERIVAMREMILASDAEGRRKALAKILPVQRADFVELFEIMGDRPVTIRLLDPPLHEFLPHAETEIGEVAAAAGVEPRVVRRRLKELEEANPMLGLRGCRLGIVYPEIYEMQVQAIVEAALEVEARTGTVVVPEIMVPLVGSARELELVGERLRKVAERVMAEKGRRIDYLVGTMIELPRAALRAGEIARHAAFFSFGTNDLTQMTLGLSRDDSGKFLDAYLEAGIFPTDPFRSLDVEGVGELVRIACARGRGTRPDLKLGICGEHGGDPASIAFCEEVGLDYVSCSPYRVPIARLAAAQAVLRRRGVVPSEERG